MAAQFDFALGLDPAPLADITQAQLIQLVGQLAPLTNIGGVVFQAGTSLGATIAQGTGGSPSVTDNPRFARYMWLNTFSAASAPPTPYFYDASTGNWTSGSAAAGSISNSHIASNAEIAVSKLADGAAREIVATDSGGTGVEWISVATLLSVLNDSVPLTAIDDTGAPGAECFLRRVGSAVTWVTFANTLASMVAAITGLPPSSISVGSPGQFLSIPLIGGATSWNAFNDIVAINTIALAKLMQDGASSGSLLRWSGAAWAPVTPDLKIASGNTIGTVGINSTSGGTGMIDQAVHTIPHGLTGVPKMVRVVAVQTNAAPEAGYAQNDEVDIHGIWLAAGNSVVASVSADGTNITVALDAVAGLGVANKTTGADTAITEANWRIKAYAWL